jgi:hypothetical protein
MRRSSFRFFRMWMAGQWAADISVCMWFCWYAVWFFCQKSWSKNRKHEIIWENLISSHFDITEFVKGETSWKKSDQCANHPPDQNLWESRMESSMDFLKNNSCLARIRWGSRCKVELWSLILFCSHQWPNNRIRRVWRQPLTHDFV